MEQIHARHSQTLMLIKFSGVYLTDLTFIEDGIPSIIKKTTLINFAKRAKTADVIRDIQQYQNVPYSLQPVTELQDYILSNMQAAGDVHEMYDKSLLIEPREREDEKIVRYVAMRDQQITCGRMALSGWLLKPAVSVPQPNLALPLHLARPLGPNWFLRVHWLTLFACNIGFWPSLGSSESTQPTRRQTGASWQVFHPTARLCNDDTIRRIARKSPACAVPARCAAPVSCTRKVCAVAPTGICDRSGVRFVPRSGSNCVEYLNDPTREIVDFWWTISVLVASLPT